MESAGKEQLPHSSDVKSNRLWIQTNLPQMRPAASECGTKFNAHCRHGVCRGRRAVRARQSRREIDSLDDDDEQGSPPLLLTS